MGPGMKGGRVKTRSRQLGSSLGLHMSQESHDSRTSSLIEVHVLVDGTKSIIISAPIAQDFAKATTNGPSDINKRSQSSLTLQAKAMRHNCTMGMYRRDLDFVGTVKILTT